MLKFRVLQMAGLAAVSLATLPCAQAFNAYANRQIVPLGESQSFLGNAGIGHSHDTGAVYYNPGDLSELPSSRISVTTSVYANFTTQSDGILYLDNTNVPYKAGGFSTIPAFYVAASKLSDNWTGAISVLVPVSLQVDNRTRFQTPLSSGNIVVSIRTSDLWLGPSLAYRIDDRWSLGLSVYGINHQESNTVGLNSAGSTAGNIISQNKLSTLGLSAIVGTTFKATDWMELGLRAQTPYLQFSGSADTYRNATAISTAESLDGTRATFEIPFDFGFGTAFTPTSWLMLLADANLQLGASYDSLPDSALNAAEDFQPTFRFNLGLEVKPVTSIPIRLGFYYDPSANGGDRTRTGFQYEDYFGVTAGIGFNSTRVQTTVGGFYVWSTGKQIPTGSINPVDAHSQLYGGLLTATYLL